MCLKKNAFSYVCWAIMSMAMVAFILLWGNMLSQTYVSGNSVVSTFLVVAVGGLAYGMYKLIGVILKYSNSMNSDCINSKTSIVEELIIVGLLLVAFFTVRIYLLSILTVDTAYFTLAQITDTGRQNVEFVQGSVYYYCVLLHSVYKVFGNHLIIGVQLQILLQALATVFIYMAIRRLASKIVAMLVLVVICLSSTSIDAGVTYSPQMLYLCIFGLVFWLTAEYLAYIEKATFGWKTWIYTIFLGLTIGFVCYVDITGVLLILLLASVFTVNCEPWNQKHLYIHAGCVVLSVPVMFLGMIFVDSLLSGTQFVNVLNAWCTVYSDISIDVSLITQEHHRSFLLLPVFASLGIFSFWRRKESQRFVPFILLVTGMVVLYFGGFTGKNMDGIYLLYILLVALAAVAVGELFYSPDCSMSKNRDTKNEEVPLPIEEPVFVAANAEQENVEDTEMQRRNKRKQDEANMIENPLPIPKKKEKKVMDYAFQPKPFEMMYDIRVSDKDDFDI